MGRPELIKDAKDILEMREKQWEISKKFKEKYPELNSASFISRVSACYYDVSGTPEAEKKNIELFKSIRTEQGRKNLAERYYKDMLNVDYSRMTSNDPEVIINYAKENPTLYYLAFEIKNAYGTAPYGPIYDLKPEVSEFFEQTYTLLQDGGTADALLRLYANEESFNDPEFPGDITPENAPMFMAKYMSQTSVERATDYIKLGSRNEIAGAYKELFERIKSKGLDPKDFVNIKYFDKDNKQISFKDLESKLKAGEVASFEMMSKEELEKRTQAFEHPFKYSPTTMPDDVTETRYEGVNGLGVSSISKEGMIKSNTGTFYGGVQITESIKNEIEAQPASEFLHFEKLENGEYKMSSKWPEKGIGANGEFDIRKNINIFSKAIAKKAFDNYDNIRIGNAIKEIEMDIDKHIDNLCNTLENYDKQNPKLADSFMDYVGITDPKERESFKSYLNGDPYCVSSLASIMHGMYDEMSKMAGYQKMKEEREKDTATFSHSLEKQSMFDDASIGFEKQVERLRELANCNPETETRKLFYVDCLKSSKLNATLVDVTNKYRQAHGMEAVEGGAYEISMQEKFNEKGLSTKFDQHGYFGISNVKINGKETFLSIETTAPKAGSFSFVPDVDFSGIGIYSSAEEVENTYKNDNLTYATESSGKIMNDYCTMDSEVLIHEEGMEFKSASLKVEEQKIAIEKEAEKYDLTADEAPTYDTYKKMLKDSVAELQALGKTDKKLRKAISALTNVDKFTAKPKENKKLDKAMKALDKYMTKLNKKLLTDDSPELMSKLSKVATTMGLVENMREEAKNIDPKEYKNKLNKDQIAKANNLMKTSLKFLSSMDVKQDREAIKQELATILVAESFVQAKKNNLKTPLEDIADFEREAQKYVKKGVLDKIVDSPDIQKVMDELKNADIERSAEGLAAKVTNTMNKAFNAPDKSQKVAQNVKTNDGPNIGPML